MRAFLEEAPAAPRLHRSGPVSRPRGDGPRLVRRDASIRVLICDQLPLMRDGLHTMLSATPDLTVTDATDGGAATLAAVERSRPDLVLVGLNAPREVVDLVQHVRASAAGEAGTPPSFVVLYDQCRSEDMAQLIASDVRGLIRRDATRCEVIDAIHHVQDGQTAFSPEIVDQLRLWFLRKDLPAPVPEDAESEVLTQREREILVLIGQGSSPEDIARLLFIGLTTVRTHIYRIRHKLSLKDRAQLVAYAYRTGLVGRPAAAPSLAS
ncbi:response regulator transcription factor [Streptomyces sp. NPDC006552]|uniref:response regulator transcription factor n=1 Tax=Streptomyces sp. NPDC006552 TaxID=3157179 RepID=UPI0033BDC867